jgi:ribosomal protein L40E
MKYLKSFEKFADKVNREICIKCGEPLENDECKYCDNTMTLPTKYKRKYHGVSGLMPNRRKPLRKTL